MEGDDFLPEGGKLPELKLGPCASVLGSVSFFLWFAHLVLFGSIDARQAQGFISFFKKLPQVRPFPLGFSLFPFCFLPLFGQIFGASFPNLFILFLDV